MCSGGSTDHVADSDNGGCGCFNPAPEDYWLDVDSDGFGFGEVSFEMCMDNVTEFYANNNVDIEPNCPNPDLDTYLIDDCGVCNGGNANMDIFGFCCETNEKDSCGVCFGNDSYCNQPVAENQNIETQEDNQIQIVLSANDPNDDPIFYSIIEEPGNGMLLGTGQSLIYDPNPNFSGLDTFIFTATDGSWTSSPATISINIQSVNDVPTVADISVISLEDNDISIDLMGYDVDGDTLLYVLTTESLYGSTSLSGSQLVYIPLSDFNGIDSMLYTAFDSQNTSSEGVISINITPVFDPPYVSSIPDTTILEDEFFTYNLEAVDVDGDELNYFITTDVNTEANIIDGILVITPPDNYFGEILVAVTVSDGVFDINQNFILTVISINDSPILSPILNQSVLEDTELVIEIIASDPDGDDITFITENTGNAFVSITDNYIHLIPEQNFNGEFGVLVRVSDGELIDSTEFSVNVLPINDPPELIGEIQDITVFENSEDIEVLLSEIFYDIENGSDLAYSVSENIEGLTTNVADTVLILLFIEGIYGLGTVEITASDYVSRTTVSTSFNVEIIPVNNPPIIDAINVELDEDSEIEVVLSAQDPDGDLLSYSIVNAPIFGSLISMEETVYVYSPESDFFGTDSFTFLVSDGVHQIEAIAEIIIFPVNDIPFFLSDSLPDAMENNLYDVDILISDIDNSLEELTLSIVNAPSWLEINGNTINGIPGHSSKFCWRLARLFLSTSHGSMLCDGVQMREPGISLRDARRQKR